MAKKVMTFRIDESDQKKVQMIEIAIKNSDEDMSTGELMSRIINIAYNSVTTEGTSSIFNEKNFLLSVGSTVERKIEEEFENSKQQPGDEKINQKLLFSMLELLEDVELILKLLPYSRDYKDENGADKTKEILKLVSSKSMFRKYTQMKVKKLIEDKNIM